ncbi:hypothetical protein [Hydrogenophaga sp. BPS33]|uniref:hypothetical protein n=1 Tax=Hydrogenophaga sp. BPS33 TaxID=2651974 RepID=UPI00131FA0CB|nr:hypothetical protein [Hydrogenophaga sp. BPS33]QHE86166.1 hypothetical protein F9K07_15270 [Hydrogenophaga sp. BPS33]
MASRTGSSDSSESLRASGPRRAEMLLRIPGLNQRMEVEQMKWLQWATGYGELAQTCNLKHLYQSKKQQINQVLSADF